MQLQGHPHRRISRFVRLFSSACYCCKWCRYSQFSSVHDIKEGTHSLPDS
jgi:hypothetical protein